MNYYSILFHPRINAGIFKSTFFSFQCKMDNSIDSISLSHENLQPNMASQDNIRSKPSSNEETESSALLALFFYSILMFTVPFGGYMAVKHYLEQNFQLGYIYNLVLPIIVGVILVNVIIMMYVFRAFREDEKDRLITNRPIEERKKLE